MPPPSRISRTRAVDWARLPRPDAPAATDPSDSDAAFEMRKRLPLTKAPSPLAAQKVSPVFGSQITPMTGRPSCVQAITTHQCGMPAR